MSTVAEQVKLALQLDTLKFECREMQDRLRDLSKAIKEQDVDGIEFFLSSLKTELVTCIKSHVGLWLCCSKYTSKFIMLTNRDMTRSTLRSVSVKVTGGHLGGTLYNIEVEHLESIKAMHPGVAVNVYSLRELETAGPGPAESEPPRTPEHRIRRALFPSATPTTGGSSGSGQ